MQIEGIGHSQFHIRQQLRLRISKTLLPHPSHLFRPEDNYNAPDERILALLLDTTIELNASVTGFKERYERLSAKSKNGLPSFEEAVSRGWFWIVWDIVYVPSGFRDFLRFSAPPYGEELIRFLSTRFGCQCSISNPTLYRDVKTWIKPLLAKKTPEKKAIPVQSSEWVTARLWDRSSKKNIRQFVYRRQLLPFINLDPYQVWSEKIASDFCMRVLEEIRQAGLPTWEDIEKTSLGRMRQTGDARVAAGENARGYLGKYFALLNSSFESTGGGDIGNDVLSLLVPVLTSVHSREGGEDLPTIAKDVVALALQYPNILLCIDLHILGAPSLLADLLIQEETCLYAAYKIALWSAPYRNFDDIEKLEADNKCVAFSGAMKVVEYFLKRRIVSVIELVELLLALEGERLHSNRLVREAALKNSAVIDEMLSTLENDTKKELLNELLSRNPNGTDTVEFSVLVNLLRFLDSSLIKGAEEKISKWYWLALEPGGGRRNLDLVNSSGALALINALESNTRNEKINLGRPFDMKSRLAIHANGVDPSFELGRSLRAHVQLLARGISAVKGEVPTELVKAFADVLNITVFENPKKGKLSVLTEQYDSLLLSPALIDLKTDVGNAINAQMQTKDRNILLKALEKSDDIGFIAFLLSVLPEKHHLKLSERLEELASDDEALPIFDLTTLKRTISGLIAAGKPDEAARQVEAAKRKSHWHNNPRLALLFFSLDLTIFFACQNYKAILEHAIPRGMRPDEEREASLLLDFYKGLSHLVDTSPNYRYAAGLFSSLTRRAPTVAHATNLLIARRMLLTNGVLTKTVSGQDAVDAISAIAEADGVLEKLDLDDQALTIYRVNRAILELALNWLTDAEGSLSKLPSRLNSAEVIAIKALIECRLGNTQAAENLIEAGKKQFGKNEALQQVYAHFKKSTPVVLAADVVTSSGLYERMTVAFADFGRLDPTEQWQVAYPKELSFERFVMDRIRNALSSIGNLAPFLKLSVNTHEENDFNALLCQLLLGNLSWPYQWHVKEQSPGGYTKGPGRGERDIVISKENTDFVILEAFKFKTGGTKASIEHLKKVFDYSSARLFVHVTYYDGSQGNARRDDLSIIAENPCPGLQLVYSEKINVTDTRPGGLFAQYKDAEDERFHVIFLLLDLNQLGGRVTTRSKATKSIKTIT